MKRFEIFFGIIKIPVDFLMTLVAFIAAYELRLITDPISGIAKPIDESALPTDQEYLIFSLISAAVLVIMFTIGNMYSLKTTTRYSREMKQTLILVGTWAMFLITYFFLTSAPFSRLAMIYSWIFTFLLIITGRGLIRILQKTLQKYGIGRRKIIFIGNNQITQELEDKISKDYNFEILGIIGQRRKKKKQKLKILGPISKFEKIIKKHKVDEIIQTQHHFSETLNEDIIELCDLYHIDYRFVPDLLEVRRTNIDINTIGSLPVISLMKTPLDGWGKVAKRIIDFSLALSGIITLSPIFILTAIAIKIDSKGPILFTRLDNGDRVKRVGKHGNLFNFYKFRSMKDKSDSLRKTALAKQNKKSSGPLTKIKNDPRITRVGKFIRKYSIDEFPQLFNVLIGNLSIVGPRPHLPEEVEKYKNHHRFVLTIKPGITGLSQISGREEKIDFEHEVRLDRFYIENWSIWMDIRIILKTIAIVLKGENE